MEKTIDIIKEKRKVPEAAKARVKDYNRIRKVILNTLKEGPRTIPQIAMESGLPQEQITYYLMTLRKFGVIETDEIDDMDEYFSYKLVNKK
jgi:predicted transcriptional regulator